MNGWSCLIAVSMVLSLSLGVRGDEPVAQDAPAAEAEQLQQWVAQLGSNQYVQREIASLELGKRGAAAVPALIVAAQRGDLELTERAMQLLQRVALSERPRDEPVAWNAIVQLAENGNGTAASRARSAMQSISLRRQELAREELARHGILVGLSNFVMEASAINEEIVHIPATWEGDETALDWLAWLHGIQYAAVEGATINREVLRRVTLMPDVHNIVIANTKLSSEDLRPLLELDRIDQLEIRYTPVDDEATKLISELPIRQKLILNGTQITPQGLENIRDLLPGLQIVYKRGGFLGVNCNPWEVRCEITRVVAGGAAEQAGIRAGDIVTAVADQPIGRFADLQEAIGVYAPGQEIPITLERAGQVVKVVAQLGSLQSDTDSLPQ